MSISEDMSGDVVSVIPASPSKHRSDSNHNVISEDTVNGTAIPVPDHELELLRKLEEANK